MELKTYDYYANLLRLYAPQLQAQFDIRTLGIFGSYVRGEQDTESDLDLLVAFDKLPSLVQFIRLEEYLHQLTGVKVDLVMADGLKPTIGQRVLREVVWI